MTRPREVSIVATTQAGVLAHLDVNATHSLRGILVKIDRGHGPQGGAAYAYVAPGQRAKVHLDGRCEAAVGFEEWVELGGESG